MATVTVPGSLSEGGRRGGHDDWRPVARGECSRVVEINQQQQSALQQNACVLATPNDTNSPQTK